ncbi:Retinol dehydrogenase 16 [Bulinus truncatus]|nr:Retinol dehydrogenase 16 [Bulinus truncatus]
MFWEVDGSHEPGEKFATEDGDVDSGGQPGTRVVVVCLSGSSVFKTGCDTGFGHMLAIKLCKEGYKVYAGCLDVEGEGAKSLQMYTSSALKVLQLDVTSLDQIEAARDFITDDLMGNVLWAIVNNAGIASHTEFEWLPTSMFEKMLQVNFMGTVNVTRVFLPLIRAARGRIINIASMAGRTALPGFTAYSASKFAVIGFTDSLRREMKHFDVQVITVEPSLYKTGIASRTNFLLQNDVFWSIAEPSIRRDYGESFFRNTQVARENLLRWARGNVEEVIECCLHAVCAAHPSHRYAPPVILQMLNDAMNTLFIGIQDFIIYYVTGLDSKPDSLCHTRNVIEYSSLGRRRSYAT